MSVGVVHREWSWLPGLTVARADLDTVIQLAHPVQACGRSFVENLDRSWLGVGGWVRVHLVAAEAAQKKENRLRRGPGKTLDGKASEPRTVQARTSARSGSPSLIGCCASASRSLGLHSCMSHPLLLASHHLVGASQSSDNEHTGSYEHA